jgi:hypothetical protein
VNLTINNPALATDKTIQDTAATTALVADIMDLPLARSSTATTSMRNDDDDDDDDDDDNDDDGIDRGSMRNDLGFVAMSKQDALHVDDGQDDSMLDPLDTSVGANSHTRRPSPNFDFMSASFTFDVSPLGMPRIHSDAFAAIDSPVQPVQKHRLVQTTGRTPELPTPPSGVKFTFDMRHFANLSPISVAGRKRRLSSSSVDTVDGDHLQSSEVSSANEWHNESEDNPHRQRMIHDV